MSNRFLVVFLRLSYLLENYFFEKSFFGCKILVRIQDMIGFRDQYVDKALLEFDSFFFLYFKYIVLCKAEINLNKTVLFSSREITSILFLNFKQQQNQQQQHKKKH